MIPIELKENQVEYDCEILFDRNEIIIDSNSISNESNTNNRIRYINDMINNPEEYKKYHIEFQEEEYEVIGEVLFGLMINQFKKKIEKEWIIQESIIHIPTNNHITMERIRISLESIGLHNILINPVDDSHYELYQEQEQTTIKTKWKIIKIVYSQSK